MNSCYVALTLHQHLSHHILQKSRRRRTRRSNNNNNDLDDDAQDQDQRLAQLHWRVANQSKQFTQVILVLIASVCDSNLFG